VIPSGKNTLTAKIKICGITNQPDAQLAVELGADLLGFNFYQPSPRYIVPAAAAKIIDSLPHGPEIVGLFVNAEPEFIWDVLNYCPLTMVQLHGDESNTDCRAIAQLGLKVIKAIRIRKPGDVRQAENFDTELILLDAFRKDLYGGTGESFDWDWITSVPDKRIFLAGGIDPDNIKAALNVGTYGIDLCSGVEKQPGIKDHARLRLLFERIAE
jgi:phosphoribosylanthranilate isomerase